MTQEENLIFGGRKYSAFNLMIARWLAVTKAAQRDIVYVTMGGTEMYDVANLCWIEDSLVGSIFSFEQDPMRFRAANRTAERLSSKGLVVRAIKEDFFTYERRGDNPHAFFIDLTGAFHKAYSPKLKEWFTNDNLRPQDLILITSYLGRNPGWKKVLSDFTEEFNILEVAGHEEQKALYRVVHPSFILYSALVGAGFQDELLLTSLGSIKYHDTSPMGLYGFLVSEGNTSFQELIRNTRVFDSVSRDWYMALSA